MRSVKLDNGMILTWEQREAPPDDDDQSRPFASYELLHEGGTITSGDDYSPASPHEAESDYSGAMLLYLLANDLGDDGMLTRTQIARLREAIGSAFPDHRLEADDKPQQTDLERALDKEVTWNRELLSRLSGQLEALWNRIHAGERFDWPTVGDLTRMAEDLENIANYFAETQQ